MKIIDQLKVILTSIAAIAILGTIVNLTVKPDDSYTPGGIAFKKGNASRISSNLQNSPDFNLNTLSYERENRNGIKISKYNLPAYSNNVTKLSQSNKFESSKYQNQTNSISLSSSSSTYNMRTGNGDYNYGSAIAQNNITLSNSTPFYNSQVIKPSTRFWDDWEGDADTGKNPGVPTGNFASLIPFAIAYIIYKTKYSK